MSKVDFAKTVSLKGSGHLFFIQGPTPTPLPLGHVIINQRIDPLLVVGQAMYNYASVFLWSLETFMR